MPSPALVISCVALVVALSGTAVAAGIVANARHANKADLAARALNSDKLQGRTAVQIAVAGAQAGAQLPGPASSVDDLVTVKSATWSFAPGAEGDVAVSCDPGQKAVSGGWDDPGGRARSRSPDRPRRCRLAYPRRRPGGRGRSAVRNGIRDLPQITRGDG